MEADKPIKNARLEFNSFINRSFEFSTVSDVDEHRARIESLLGQAGAPLSVLDETGRATSEEMAARLDSIRREKCLKIATYAWKDLTDPAKEWCSSISPYNEKKLREALSACGLPLSAIQPHPRVTDEEIEAKISAARNRQKLSKARAHFATIMKQCPGASLEYHEAETRLMLKESGNGFSALMPDLHLDDASAERVFLHCMQTAYIEAAKDTLQSLIEEKSAHRVSTIQYAAETAKKFLSKAGCGLEALGNGVSVESGEKVLTETIRKAHANSAEKLFSDIKKDISVTPSMTEKTEKEIREHLQLAGRTTAEFSPSRSEAEGEVCLKQGLAQALLSSGRCQLAVLDHTLSKCSTIEDVYDQGRKLRAQFLAAEAALAGHAGFISPEDFERTSAEISNTVQNAVQGLVDKGVVVKMPAPMKLRRKGEPAPPPPELPAGPLKIDPQFYLFQHESSTALRGLKAAFEEKGRRTFGTDSGFKRFVEEVLGDEFEKASHDIVRTPERVRNLPLPLGFNFKMKP